MIDEWDKWKTTTEDAMEEVGSSSETLTDDITSDMEDIGDATEDLADDIDAQTKNMITYIDNLMDKVEDWRKKYIDAIGDIIDANEKLTGVEEGEEESDSPATTPTTTTPETNSKQDDNLKAQASDIAAEAQAIIKGVHNGSIAQTSSGWKASAKAAGYSDEAIKIA
jgi:hypothetical protein